MSVKKIYISPSSQPANSYAVGNTNEQEQCRKIGIVLHEALKRCGFESMVGLSGTMYDRVRESNEWGADLHVPVHTNAWDTKLRGTRMFCSSLNGNGGKACKAIFDALAPIVPGESDNIQTASYYEITATKAPCAYTEAAFHDNAEQAAWIIAHIADLGEAICKGICNYYGVKYVPANGEAENPAEEKDVYRIQLGAFNSRDRAENMLKDVHAAGFTDAFIRKN